MTPTLCCLLLLAPAADLFVAPTGDDANPGTAASPLRTVAAARDRLRDRLPTMTRDLQVHLAGGDYLVAEPIVFGPEDAGRNGHRVLYRGDLADRPRLFGGRPVTGWTRLEGPLWRATVPPGTVFQQLFVDGVRQTKARHPNTGYFEVEAGDPANPTTVFGYRAGDLPPGDIGPEAQVYLWAGYDWFSNTLPVRAVDHHQRTITLARPALAPITRRPHRRYYFQGFRGALDAPGEWFLDETSGELLLVWPDGSPNDRQVLYPVVDTVLAVRGRSAAERAGGLELRGLTVGLTRFGASFQEIDGTHGRTTWNEPANLHGVIECRDAVDVAIQGCEIVGGGYSGVSVHGASERVRVTDCWLHDHGYHGVLLQGPAPRLGPDQPRHGGHAIVNCRIDHCGRLVGHGGGVFVHSSQGNRVAHCAIAHMPRYGICGKGGVGGPAGAVYEESIPHNTTRDNVFELNDISYCNEDSEDSGFISFHTTGTGNIVRQNLLHDCVRDLGGLSFGIYLDDGAGYFTLERNIIWHIGGGSPQRCCPIYAKGIENRLTNNILVGEERTEAAIRAAYMFGRRGDRHTYTRNIVYLRGADSLAWYHQNWVPERLVACDDNLFWNTAGPVRFAVREQALETFTFDQWRRWRGAGWDSRSRIADPRFTDPAAADWRLKTDSPALALGFEPIDQSECGLRAGFPFPRD